MAAESYFVIDRFYKGKRMPGNMYVYIKKPDYDICGLYISMRWYKVVPLHTLKSVEPDMLISDTFISVDPDMLISDTL